MDHFSPQQKGHRFLKSRWLFFCTANLTKRVKRLRERLYYQIGRQRIPIIYPSIPTTVLLKMDER